ncbi:hypothetical protein D3C80_1938560 [compost metagenome]
MTISRITAELTAKLNDTSGNFRIKRADNFIERFRSEIAFSAFADRYRTGIHLILSDNEHIWKLLQLGFTDLIAHLLIAQIDFSPDAALQQLRFHFLGIVIKG